MSALIICFFALFATVTAQTCSNTGIGPCSATNTCQTGYTCTTSSTICCLNANVIAATTTCVDKTNPSTGVSDCTRLSYLCNNASYYTLMTQQCPRTCGRCSVTTVTTTATTCVDKTNPSTGVSDCTRLAYLCNNSSYYTLMTQQCPRTCGRC